jgi:hypothetical protein
LEKPASLVITSSGSTHFLLQGSGRDHTELNEKLELLHESVNAMSPTSRITHRTLDNRFTARDIRVNDNNYERTFYENSWKIHNVNYSEKKLEFLTAKRGTDYMISNSETLLMKAVREEKHAVALPIPESISSKRILGGGMIKKETLQKLKDLLFIDASVLPFPTEDGAIWSTTEHGKITTLIIQNML